MDAIDRAVAMLDSVRRSEDLPMESGMQIMIDDADLHLRAMIDAALRGEEVTIASGSVPILRLVPVETRRFTYGVMADKLKGPIPDFLEPMSDEELHLWEGGDERNR